MSLRDVLARLQSAATPFRIRALLLPGSVMAIFFALHSLDPFGIGEASGERSDQQTLRVTAPFYVPSRQVTVILIDDDYLKGRGLGWPLSYGEQGTLLRRVLTLKPAVLVVDLVYPHRHREAHDGTTAATPAPAPGDPLPTGGTAAGDEPAALLQPIRAVTDIPVIFTAMAGESPPGRDPYQFCGPYAGPTGMRGMLDPASIQPELLEAIDASATSVPRTDWRLALVRWSGCGSRYPLVFAADPTTVTPAFAAYRAYCERAKDSGIVAGVHCDVGPRDTQAKRFGPPMTVQWGAFPPFEQTFAHASTCQETADRSGFVAVSHRIWASVKQMTLGLFTDLRDDPDPQLALPCPAVTIAPLSVLDQARREDWNDLIAGHIVLVGASISGIPDMISSPVHGQLPGVVLHAMAVDNLLRSGAGYLTDPQDKTLLSLLIVLAFALAFPSLIGLLEHPILRRWLGVLSLGLWLALAAEYLCLDRRSYAAAALALGLALDIVMPTNTAVYFALVAVAATIAGVTLRAGWPPGNWLGLVLLLFALSHALRPFFHGEERRRLPSPYSVLARIYRRLRGQVTPTTVSPGAAAPVHSEAAAAATVVAPAGSQRPIPGGG